MLHQLTIKNRSITQEDQAFMQDFENKVQETITQYELFTKQDKILVAVSGGKDSTVLLSILHKLGYPVEAITVDVHIGCYTQENVERIKTLCNNLNIALHVKTFNEMYGKSVCHIRDAAAAKTGYLTSCTVCGVLRRKILNQVTREQGATVIATGHNLDDEAGSILMNLLRNNLRQLTYLGPGTKADSTLFVKRVKPLYFHREEDIIRYSKLKEFDVVYTHCPCSTEAFRTSIKRFFKDTAEEYPELRENIAHFILEHQAALRAHLKSETQSAVKKCERCGEPAMRTLCRSCRILNAGEVV